MAVSSLPRNTIPPRHWWMLFGSLVLIYLGTLMPGYIKNAALDMMGPQYPWPRLAHFLLFGLLASVPIYGPGWRGTLRLMLLALVVAVSTELLQSLVPGRHPTVRDALIDLTGALVVRLLWLRAGARRGPRP